MVSDAYCCTPESDERFHPSGDWTGQWLDPGSADLPLELGGGHDDSGPSFE